MQIHSTQRLIQKNLSKAHYSLEQEGEREKTRGVRTAEGIDVPNSVLAKVEAWAPDKGGTDGCRNFSP